MQITTKITALENWLLIILIDLITDLDESDVNYGNSKITVSGNSFFGQSNRVTNQIDQLNLGECAGEVIAPDLIDPTPTETLMATATETPTKTSEILVSDSEIFTNSEIFSESEFFTFSEFFSESENFTFSKSFTPSRVRDPEKEVSLDLSNGQIVACVAAPSLFFLLLIGIVVFILIAKKLNFKKLFKSNYNDDGFSDDDETLSIDDENESENINENEHNNNAFWNDQKENYIVPS